MLQARRRVAAIRYAHKIAGQEPPTNGEGVKALMRGIRRTIGAAKVQKAPATSDCLRAMIDRCPDTLKGKRDLALCLLLALPAPSAGLSWLA